ncbi:unnamed protein product, partial [Durusdinium trenchii]
CSDAHLHEGSHRTVAQLMIRQANLTHEPGVRVWQWVHGSAAAAKSVAVGLAPATLEQS